MKTRHERMYEYIENQRDMGQDTKMRFIPLPNDDVSAVHITSLFDSNLELPEFVTGIGNPYQENSANEIFGDILGCTMCCFEKIHIKGLKIFGDSISGWLVRAINVREVILEDIDFSNISNTVLMFSELPYLKSVKFINCNMRSIKNMSEMFCELPYLKSVQFINCNISSIKNMSKMFYICEMLEDVDIRCFDTKNVTDMSSMFCWCRSLKQIDLSNFDTSKVESMNDMFCHCFNLREIDLSNFKTDKVETFGSMFSDCCRLEKVDISNFHINSGAEIQYMFTRCNNLKEIEAKENYTEILIEASKLREYESNCLLDYFALGYFDNSESDDEQILMP